MSKFSNKCNTCNPRCSEDSWVNKVKGFLCRLFLEGLLFMTMLKAVPWENASILIIDAPVIEAALNSLF